MKVLNVIAAFAVLACNLIVSFNHSLELFRAGGFSNGLEYVAVFGCEITFVMGGLNLVVSRLKGYSPGTPAILGGLLGVLLVVWSNVAAGWEYGITGILLGFATPVSLVVAEAILTRAVLQRSSKTPEMSPSVGERLESAEEEPPWTVERLEPDPPDFGDELEDEKEEPPTILETVENSPTELEAPPEEMEKVEEDSPTTPYEWAVHLYKLEGKPPTRRRLMEVAGCKEWPARQALEQLKETLGEST